MNPNPCIQADLRDKVILITGASQGLGAYYAELLAKNHATVIVSGRSDDKINQVVERIKSNGGQAFPLNLNMNDYHTFESKVDEIIRKFHHIDVLINNAAVSQDNNIFDITELIWDNLMGTNLKGLFFLSQSVANKMRTQSNGGNIINIAAINGEQVRKNNIVFGTSKAAVIHLTKSMAFDLIDSNIRVNALSIGLFPSDSVKDYIANDPRAKDYIAQIPAKRAGKLTELDGPILLLASDASRYMTGSVLKVDGGFAINVFMNS